MTEETSDKKHNPDYVLWGFLAATTLLLIAAGTLGYIGYNQYQDIKALQATQLQLETTLTEKLTALDAASSTILALTTELNITEEELEDIEDDYRREKEKNDEFEDQLDDLTGTLKDLDKLSKTDEELLQKYSKVYFLNENYVPSDLDEISSRYVHDSKDDEYFHGDALPFLEDLMKEARKDDMDTEIISAYRSFDEQNDLKGQFTQIYGEGANAFSADQGFSEHQLGTTVDFGTTNLASAEAAFVDTDAYEWLLKNAYKYGFVLSYPEDNQFYIFEPWHWRFVGTDLARDLNRDDAYFYDWDQRDIDEYLIKIFD